MRLFSRSVKKNLKEMNASAFITLRNSINLQQGGFAVSPTLGTLFKTEIDYDRVRRLYYNQDAQLSNGAFFAKPIVDGISDAIGLPIVNLKDENLDNKVQGWINNGWKKQLWEMYRASLRDTDCWVRLRQPIPGPFTADDERDDVTIEILEADSVTPYYDPFTHQLNRVEVAMDVYIEDEPFDPNNILAQGARSNGRMHRIIEIVTPEQYLYFDETLSELVESATIDNKWNFVPFLQVFNDYDSALHGGASVLENVFPFLQAFHDVCVQTRQSHAYHADPKVKFKLDDVMTFLRNNFPEAFNGDEFSGQISWKGKDVYFMESEEDADFIEATLKTSDSVALMEFLIDCICIAAEVTEEVLFRKNISTGQSENKQRFKTRIERSRNGFAEYIQQIVKMALKISTGQVTTSPSISWPAMEVADLVAEGTAMNQIVTAAEVANRAGVISRSTYRSRVRQFFPNMKDDSEEESQAQTEQQAEQDKQLKYEKALSQFSGPSLSKNGQNGAGSSSRIKLPVDVVSPSNGN